MRDPSVRPGRIRLGFPDLRCVAAIMLVMLSACGDSATEPVPDDPTPPVFSVPVVDLLSLREFVPFGLTGTQRTSSWELITTGTGHEVRAVTGGRVIEVLANPQGGSQIHVLPGPGSIWTVIYDHVSGVLVDEGDEVDAGATLGATSVRTPTTGRVDLKVILTHDPDVAHCPANFGTESFKAAHDAAFAMTGSPHPGVCLSGTAVP